MAPSRVMSEHAHGVDKDGKALKHTAKEAKSTRSTLPPLPLMSPQVLEDPVANPAERGRSRLSRFARPSTMAARGVKRIEIQD